MIDVEQFTSWTPVSIEPYDKDTRPCILQPASTLANAGKNSHFIGLKAKNPDDFAPSQGNPDISRDIFPFKEMPLSLLLGSVLGCIWMVMVGLDCELEGLRGWGL